MIEQLNNLRKITPSEDFARKLKGIVLSTPRPQRQVWSIASLRPSVREGFSFAVSVGLVAVLIVLFVDVNPHTTSEIVGTANPGANSVSMLNEANAAVADINIHLAEVSTFDAAAQQTSDALSNINPTSINKEKSTISSSDVSGNSDATKIDSILNQLSN